MSAAFWSLPGPNRFVSRVRSDVWAGKNVIVTSKAFCPGGLLPALEAAIRENDLILWRPLVIGGMEEAPPPEAVGRRLCPDEMALGVTAARIATMAQLRGSVILISDVPRPRAADWALFVADYANIARNAAEEPPQFLLCLQGFEDEPGMRRAGVVVHHAEDSVWASDTVCLVSARVADNGCRLHRLVHAAVAAELAGTDLELAERLAALGLRNLMRPQDTLSGRAREFGWHRATSDDQATERWQGRRRRHSAFEVLAGNTIEIDRRIWRGEVQALFPLVEELRLQLVSQVRHLLRLPFKTEWGVVEDAEDLEVGPLYYLLKQEQAPRPAVQLARILKSLRHDLAHLRPVRVEDLYDDRLIQASE